jgi:hypothetical protein
MTRIRAILGLVLASALLATLAVNAADDNTKKKKKDGTTFGTVTAVTPLDKETGMGTITIKVGAGKGKGVAAGANAAAAADGDTPEKKFTYDKDTTFEKMSGKKKKDTATATDCKDQRVIITSADGKKADKVTIPQAPKTDN